MRAPIFLPRRGDILGILLVVLVVAVVLFASVKYPALFWQHGSGASFGPDWDCQYVAKGEPVCIKKMPKGPGS